MPWRGRKGRKPVLIGKCKWCGWKGQVAPNPDALRNHVRDYHPEHEALVDKFKDAELEELKERQEQARRRLRDRQP